MSDQGTNSEFDWSRLGYQLGEWWRLHPRGRWVAVGAVVVMLVALVAFASIPKPTSDAIPMPASASDFKGEHYNDVVTRLKSAGFSSVETTSVDDLVLGWLTKDGEVEKVSANGDTEFAASSRFPKDAKILVTYHTFPKNPPKETEGSEQVEVAAVAQGDDAAPAEVDDTVLTSKNNKELKAVLKAENPGDPEVQAFIRKYVGRTIEFDGYTLDWIGEPGYDTIYSTNIYVGDVKNVEVSSVGPTFRVERYQWPNFVPELNRMNVHVKATVDGYDSEHEFFEISPVAIDAR